MDERAAADFRSLSEVQGAVVVFDPSCKRHSIAACSRGFECLTGFVEEDVRSQTPDVILKAVPALAISRSAWKNFASYCRSSRGPDIACMGESSVPHPFSRKNGTVFTSMMTLGYVVARGSAYVAAVHAWLGEGPVVPPLKQDRFAELEDINRKALKALRQRFYACEAPAYSPVAGNPGPISGGISFYTERLQERAIVFSGGASAARREPEELPAGCLLFGSAPLEVHGREGLRYALQVDGLSTSFRGLPFFGFTRKRPADRPGLYPRLSKCLAQSVFVGGFGEAFSRRQEHDFEAGFRRIPQTEVASWCLQEEVPPHLRNVPAEVKLGDHVECRYTCEGHVQFWLNMALLFDFNTGFPPEVGAKYWPAVDICNSVSAVSLLAPCRPRADHHVPRHLEAAEGLSATEEECPLDSDIEVAATDGLKRGTSTSSSLSDASTDCGVHAGGACRGGLLAEGAFCYTSESSCDMPLQA